LSESFLFASWPSGRWHLGGLDLAPIRPAICDGLSGRSPVLGIQKAGTAMPIDPSDLARSIGALGSLDPQRGLAPTLQQITDAAKQLFRADGSGLMLVDSAGALRWASASDQSAQTVEDSQERLAQGPCAVAFSQRLPAAIRNIRLERDWQEFTQVLVSEGVCAALSVPVELDGGVIGTLDIYSGDPRDWDPSEVAALQAYAGLVASLLSAAVTAQVTGRLASQLQAALEHRWLIEQAKGVLMGREQLDAQTAFERLRGVARASTRRVVDVARDVTAGQPLPANRRDMARGRAEQAKDRETAT
jgi:ANTAR domain/GAF domain